MTLNCSILIGTYGDESWSELAWSRAYPSAALQEATEVLVRHEPDGTLADVRNALAADAKGHWLCYCDADDELAPGYLNAMAALEKECALLVPALERIYLDRRRDRPAIPNRGRWPELNECVIGTLIERDLFACLGGFRELASIEDYDLFLRAYDDGAGLVYVEDAVYRAYVSPTGGRNLDQGAYAAIWAEHRARIAP